MERPCTPILKDHPKIGGTQRAEVGVMDVVCKCILQYTTFISVLNSTYVSYVCVHLRLNED